MPSYDKKLEQEEGKSESFSILPWHILQLYENRMLLILDTQVM